ncbi:hypothetical protein H072_3238 [Dactylellina haptotyla CBS 200.50]|uniref:Uncharacterized protein n=1 Tax=Dactylellina haptotyla (strain CBS 200.50) TaxID=1284197 RepID=S8AIR2_DACHA|nr:hypothetical protein H072_3238 [Dactylellina haptotyla CBS 200.50]
MSFRQHAGESGIYKFRGRLGIKQELLDKYDFHCLGFTPNITYAVFKRSERSMSMYSPSDKWYLANLVDLSVKTLIPLRNRRREKLDDSTLHAGDYFVVGTTVGTRRAFVWNTQGELVYEFTLLSEEGISIASSESYVILRNEHMRACTNDFYILNTSTKTLQVHERFVDLIKQARQEIPHHQNLTKVAMSILEESQEILLTGSMVSKRWHAILSDSNLANSIIRRNYRGRTDIVDYVEVKDRFSVLRNLAFRSYAHSHSLLMKTKEFHCPEEDMSAVTCHKGLAVVAIREDKEFEDDEELHRIIVLDISRKSSMHPTTIQSVMACNCFIHAGSGFVVTIRIGKPDQVTVYDYSGRIVHTWALRSSPSKQRRYLYGISYQHVVVRVQDVDTQQVQYEIFNAVKKIVKVYEVAEDILSAQTKSAKTYRESKDSDDETGEMEDWSLSRCEIRINDSEKTFRLSHRYEEKPYYHIQQFSFASETKGIKLQDISKIKIHFPGPTPPEDEDDRATWSYAARGRGVMTGIENAEDGEYLDVTYVWYDYESTKDSIQNVNLSTYTVHSLFNNPFVEAESGTFFVMGDTLYALFQNEDLDCTELVYLKRGELECYDQDAISLGPEMLNSLDVLCDDRYAMVAYTGGAIVFEWHDYDSWKECQEEDWEYKEQVGEIIWEDDESDRSFVNIIHV